MCNSKMISKNKFLQCANLRQTCFVKLNSSNVIFHMPKSHMQIQTGIQEEEEEEEEEKSLSSNAVASTPWRFLWRLCALMCVG